MYSMNKSEQLDSVLSCDFWNNDRLKFLILSSLLNNLFKFVGTGRFYEKIWFNWANGFYFFNIIVWMQN